MSGRGQTEWGEVRLREEPLLHSTSFYAKETVMTLSHISTIYPPERVCALLKTFSSPCQAKADWLKIFARDLT